MSRPGIGPRSQELASCAVTARPPQHNTTGPRHRAFDVFKVPVPVSLLAIGNDCVARSYRFYVLLTCTRAIIRQKVYCKSRIFPIHFIFVYFVPSGFRTKVLCVRKSQNKLENPQRSASVRKFHAYERSEVPSTRKLVHINILDLQKFAVVRGRADQHHSATESLPPPPPHCVYQWGLFIKISHAKGGGHQKAHGA